jgi:hypothetical protein
MNPELVRRFHDRILDQAARRYGVEASDLSQLTAFENFVYEGVNSDGVDFVLRISHSTRRTFDYTMGEIEFVRYLGAVKIPVSQPILSEAGQFVERIDDSEPGHHFVVTAFERADGVVFDDAPPLKEQYWKPPLFRDLGRLFARLHNRAQTYKPSNPRYKRQEWYEYDVVDIDRFAPPDEQLVRERTWRISTRTTSASPTGGSPRSTSTTASTRGSSRTSRCCCSTSRGPRRAASATRRSRRSSRRSSRATASTAGASGRGSWRSRTCSRCSAR